MFGVKRGKKKISLKRKEGNDMWNWEYINFVIICIEELI